MQERMPSAATGGATHDPSPKLDKLVMQFPELPLQRIFVIGWPGKISRGQLMAERVMQLTRDRRCHERRKGRSAIRGNGVVIEDLSNSLRQGCIIH